MSNMKVLITGGAGFIGSHLCDVFVNEAKQVTILDNLSSGSISNIQHLKNEIELVNGDIRDSKLVDGLIESCDLVIHMAASLGVQNILRDTAESISVNFHGSEVVLRSALKYDKRIFIASTSEIYGKNPNQPLSENSDRVVGCPQKTRWSYSDAKALEEALAFSLFIMHNLRVTTVRFFNTVGPRQTGRYGMVLPRFISAAKNNEPLNIYGDGNQSRVFCHVQDAVSALVMLSKKVESIGEVFNIGGKEEISILDLAKLVIKLTQSKSKIEFIPYSEAYPKGFEDMQRRIPDLTKIQNLIDWWPKKSLENIISDMAEI